MYLCKFSHHQITSIAYQENVQVLADWGREYWASAGPGGMDAQSRAWQWLLVVYLRKPRNPFRLHNSQLTSSFKDIYGF